MTRNMRAIILAAGQGTRLAPLTNDRPKCLVEIGGTSLLDYQVATLESQGIHDLTILTGHHSELIAAKGYPTVFNPDYSSSNMVYTLFCASEEMTSDSDLIIAYGDIVYEPRVLRSLIECHAPVCVAVDVEWKRFWDIRMDDPLDDAETLKLDQRGLILELGKKPSDYDEIQGQYLGLIKVRADHVPRLVEVYQAMDTEGLYDGKTRRQMYMTSFIQHLIDIGWPVQSVPIENGWLEVDTYEELQTYNRMLEEGTLAAFCNLSSLDGSATN